MNLLVAFAIELFLTILGFSAIMAYFRPHLHRVLVDLCGTEERARFWAVFSSILLVGAPTVSALSYLPLRSDLADAALDLARQLSHNLMSFLVALVGLGLIVSFFALVAPRSRVERSA